MSFHSRKIQTTEDDDNIRIGDISLSKDKNILKGIKEMTILQKEKSLKDNNLLKDKHLPSRDNSLSKDRLLSKGENPDGIIFFPEKETKKYL